MNENDKNKRFPPVVPPSSLSSQRGPRRKRNPNLLQVAKDSITNGAYATKSNSSDQSTTESTTSSYASFFADNTPDIFSSCLSVGSGYFSLDLDGSMLFTTSPSDSSTCQGAPYFMNDDTRKTYSPSNHNNRSTIIPKAGKISPANFATTGSGKSLIRPKSPTFNTPKTDTFFSRSHASYMRVSDIQHLLPTNLDLDPPTMAATTTATATATTNKERRDASATNTASTSTSSCKDKNQYTHYHYASDLPPPGLRYDSNELWIAVDDGHGKSTPCAIQAIERLVQTLIDDFAMNSSKWILEKKPETLLPGAMHGWTIQQPLDIKNIPPLGSAAEQEVLVWTGILDPESSNSDSPPVRSEGIIHMPPEKLFDLLLDSSRVHEYNKTSLGRKDLVILHNDLTKKGPFGKSITKIVTSMNKIPLILKSLEFVTLLHGQELEHGAGYVLISRAVVRDEENTNKAKSEGILRSEILSGVNLMLRIQNDPNRCVMITANHVRSPFLPLIIAKRLGVSAAIGFVHDIRNCC